ncbi:MAG: sialate O-acetylesterase [Phycisphaeraceae bacterium]|nr:sialate O-acetylesterase [Phycisphaeraceae bacterium]
MRRFCQVFLLSVWALLLAAIPAGYASAQDAKPQKLYILSGQSNMVGMGKPPTLDVLKGDKDFAYIKKYTD